jgi:hypothetical protein
LCWLFAAFDILAAEPGSGFDVHSGRLSDGVVHDARRRQESRRARGRLSHPGEACPVGNEPRAETGPKRDRGYGTGSDVPVRPQLRSFSGRLRITETPRLPS